MLEEIASIGKQIQDQFHTIAPGVMEIFEDATVKETFPRLDYVFNAEHYQPTYGEANDTVISRYDVFIVTSGQMPNVPKPAGTKAK
jgi:hypothetical protein